ncbi:MAG: MYG1 family protein [Promethearchaeota archaeon]
MAKIITHPGGAHLDDLLSTCLVLSRNTEIELIERRIPTKEEMEDPDVWILDIGHQLSPKLLNFDHHMEDTEDCTLSLLLKEWNLWEEATRVFPWLPVVVLEDAKGPLRVQKLLGMDQKTKEAMESFVEETVLNLFQEQESIVKNSFMFILLKEIGNRFFQHLDDYKSMLLELKEKAKFKTINGVPIVQCLGVKKNRIFAQVIERMKREKWGDGGIVIYKGDRPDGSITFKRYDDDERVDFTLIAQKEKVLFTHKNGFLVVLEPIEESEIDEYISLSML